MKEILADLKNLSGNTVADIIQKFAGEVPGYNLEFKTAYDDESGRTAWVRNKTVNGNMQIFFNTNETTRQNVTDLAIATTMLHESVHAYLYAFFNEDKKELKATYPELVARFFGEKHGINIPKVQHNLMVKEFKDDIAESVYTYGMAKGYTYPKSFYQDLAWKGLLDTDGYLALPESDRNRILNILLAEQYGKGNTTQKGNKAGC